MTDQVIICEDINRRRTCGRVHCGIRTLVAASLVTDVAQQFGLSDDPRCYREITVKSALTILTLILHEDLAYRIPIMTHDEASSLASSFLEEASSPSCRYFTNGDFAESDSAGWTPATSATFDTGVLVVGSDRAACLWVEDED